MAKTVLGSLLAGVVLFFWGAFSHMVLPLGKMGVRQLSQEEPMLEAVRGSVHEPGFYFFPGKDMSRPASESEESAWLEKVKRGPVGVLVVQPSGGEAISPRQLGTQLATDLVSAILAALLLTRVLAGYWGRVLFVTVLGLFSFLVISVPYWNWYGFPTEFTVAEGIDQVVGWLLAGLVLARFVPAVKTNGSR
jgi:hypothetical protein